MRRRRRSVSYDRIVIVGGGRAGVAAAEELHRQRFRGEIIIICDEPVGPYDRPACSKGLLTGRQRPRDVVLPVRDDVDITWQLDRRVVGIDTDAQTIYTNTDEQYAYDGLIIATGVGPTSLPDWPYGEPGLHVLHTLADAWALRQDLREADRVAIVGGGVTGCETAGAVRTLARDCVIVDSNRQVMTRGLGQTIGGYVTDEIQRSGVNLRLGRRVSEVARRRRGWQLLLDDGSSVDADIVVAAVGERPDTDWLSSVDGLDLSDGILCDESLRVVGAENMVAAGAIARWTNLQHSAIPSRCGQWIAALEQGQAAARTLLAADRVAAPVTLLPRWWSDQFGMRIEVSGQLLPEADICVTEMRPGRRDVARAGVLATYVYEGRLTGAVAVNAPRAFTSVTRAMLATPLPDLATRRDDVAPVEPLSLPSTGRRRRLSSVA